MPVETLLYVVYVQNLFVSIEPRVQQFAAILYLQGDQLNMAVFSDTLEKVTVAQTEQSLYTRFQEKHGHV